MFEEPAIPQDLAVILILLLEVFVFFKELFTRVSFHPLYNFTDALK